MIPPDMGPRPCAQSGAAENISSKTDTAIEFKKLLLLRTAFSFSGDPFSNNPAGAVVLRV